MNQMMRTQGKVPLIKAIPLGFQHLFAMFGSTVLVPILVTQALIDAGMESPLTPSLALLAAGLGTLLFHFITKGKVPAYLGSSFAFITPIIVAATQFGYKAALGGCIAAGFIYVIFSTIVKMTGTGFIDRFLPPIVIGPVIMTIGLGLAPVAVNMAKTNIPVAFFTLGVTIIISRFAKGFLKVIPILLGIISGYLFAIVYPFIQSALGMEPTTLIDLGKVAAAPWFAFPKLVHPTFNISAIIIIAPIALVTVVEHLGDVLVLSKVTKENFVKEPGLHRTLLGDGLATALSGFIGGPPNTTYGENVGVIAMTKVYKTYVVTVAACLAIALSCINKLGVLISIIPSAVMGGITILLFGMIASTGMRTLIDAHTNLEDTRNLIIASIILVLGIGGMAIEIGPITLQGMGLATITGIILNMVLPKDKGANLEKDSILETE